VNDGSVAILALERSSDEAPEDTRYRRAVDYRACRDVPVPAIGVCVAERLGQPHRSTIVKKLGDYAPVKLQGCCGRGGDFLGESHARDSSKHRNNGDEAEDDSPHGYLQ
jgi:hypothetical protein